MNISSDNLRFVIGGVLLVHGLGHGGALGALIWLRVFPNSPGGGWLAARSWLFPALASPEATTVAMSFWIVAMFGFVAAALSFWGVLLPGEPWRVLAVGSAIVSLGGMIVFFGTWPMFNTLAALAVNGAVLVTQLFSRWPPQELFGH
jgi:hypothetical protein